MQDDVPIYKTRTTQERSKEHVIPRLEMAAVLLDRSQPHREHRCDPQGQTDRALGAPGKR